MKRREMLGAMIYLPVMAANPAALNIKESSRSCNRILLEAHRGNSAYAPENTLLSVSEALDIGVDRIEIDLQITSDKQPVVIHDDTLERTTNGSGLVKETSLKKLRSLDAGSWKDEKFSSLQVPLFEEVLEICKGKTMVNIDLKTLEAVPPMLKIIKEFDMENEVVITGKVPGCVEEVRKSGLHLTMFYESSPPMTQFIKKHEFKSAMQQAIMEARDYALPGFLFHHNWINPELVYLAHLHGLAVNVYDVNDVNVLHKMIDAGVDGIMTDYPALMKNEMLKMIDS